MHKLVIGTSFLITLLLKGVASANDLAGAEWGTDSKIEQFVSFKQNGNVSGFAGCNRFFGSYKATNEKKTGFGKSGKFEIEQLASTKKGCERSILKAEFEFIRKLEKANTYSRTRLHLELWDENKNSLMKLRWRDFD